jgi:single-strand DNA-binding protein
MRYATAKVTRTQRGGGGGGFGGGNNGGGGYGGNNGGGGFGGNSGGYDSPAGGSANDPWATPGGGASAFPNDPPF